jgi:flagellar biogenesis protein FliO
MSAASAPADTAIESAPGSGEPGGAGFAAGLATTAFALVVVLVLAWLSLRFVKRLQQRRGDGGADDEAPRVLRSVGLGPRERLVCVRYREHDYLLGVTPSSITLLDRDASARRAADDAP